MCSGRLNPRFVLRAFELGAAGVLITGCHPGECHYQSGNYKALSRYQLLQRLLQSLGIAEERLALEWVSAAEGEKFAQVVNRFAERLRKLHAVPEERELVEVA
jgi:F420-non-reducing hydrogenase iron-sulfur subunit